MPCQANEIPEGQTVGIVNPNDSTQDAERHTTTAIGTFSFKITLKNPLTSTNNSGVRQGRHSQMRGCIA